MIEKHQMSKATSSSLAPSWSWESKKKLMVKMQWKFQQSAKFQYVRHTGYSRIIVKTVFEYFFFILLRNAGLELHFYPI